MLNVRYVIRTTGGKSVKMIFHAFTPGSIIAEHLATGQLEAIPADELSFDPPTERLVQQHVMEQMARSALQAPVRSPGPPPAPETPPEVQRPPVGPLPA